MSDVSPSPAAPASQNGHRYSRQAGLVVCVMSAGFVVGIIGLLFMQAWLQHQELGQMAANVTANQPDDPYYYLEQEALRLRNSRASIAQLYSHFVSISGLIVSMTMVLLGAILIFDRVQSTEANTLRAILEGKASLDASSAYPGVILCVLGAVTVGLNLYFSGPKAPAFVTRDIPAFLEDMNWDRNRLGRMPCFGISTTGSDTTGSTDASNSCELAPTTISTPPETISGSPD